MKILVVNCGSSSLKYQLIDMENETLLAKGNFERIGEQEAFVTHKVNGESHVTKSPVMDHEQALKIVLEQLVHADYGVIKDLSEISAVGHRLVHGGEIFKSSVLIDDKTIEDMSYQESEISEIFFVPYKKFKEMVINKQPDLLRHNDEFETIFNMFDEKFDK